MADTACSNAETFVHPAFFYHDCDQYLAGTVPFITQGLRANEPVVAVVPADRLTLLRSALGPAAASVRMLDMTKVGRNPGRIIPCVLRKFTDEHPNRQIRIIDEPIWPQRSVVEYPACAQHEALINHAFAGRQVTIMCPYDANNLRKATLADAACTHPFLIDGKGMRRSDQYSPDTVISAYNSPLPPLNNAMTLTVDTSGLARLRHTATAFTQRRRLTKQRTDDLVLVLTELATNSIEHAHSTATVSFGGDQNLVVCQVQDFGHITDVLAGRRPADPAQQSGRGLLLVNHVADLVRMHTTIGGTTIEVHFAVSA